MNKLESQNVEDINISFNKDINSYVINISYRHTDREGNVDIISIRDLPITIYPHPIVNRKFSCYGCETSINLGFGSLESYPEITSEEIRRIHTVTKEMTIEEIEEKLGYKVKIVGNKKEDRFCCNNCKFGNRSTISDPCASCCKHSML